MTVLLKKIILIGFMSIVLSGCASTQNDTVYDPLEPMNRTVHSFNKGLDTALLKPASVAYKAITPDLFRLLISNAAVQIKQPVVFANKLLVGDFEDAGETLMRFSVNVVAGAGGLLDPASDVGLPKHNADFGMTLAEWGVGPGPYLELPGLGPSYTRGAVGTVVDALFNPLTFYGYSGNAHHLVTTASSVQQATGLLETRTVNDKIIEKALYESPDSYTRTKTLYTQNRDHQVTGGAVDVDSAPDLFD